MKIWKNCMGKVAAVALFCVLVSPSLLIASSGGEAAASGTHVEASAGHAAPVVEGVAVTEEAGVEEHHSDPLSQSKLQNLGWRIVNFIALMIILVKFGAKPLGGALSSRRKAIVSEIEELEKRKADAEQAYGEFQDKLATVEADIDKIVERAVAQAEAEKKKILEKAEAAADELKRSAEQAVQNEIAEARAVLQQEVAEKAAVMAEKIIKKNLKGNDQKAIIENYLAKVEASL